MFFAVTCWNPSGQQLLSAPRRSAVARANKFRHRADTQYDLEVDFATRFGDGKRESLGLQIRDANDANLSLARPDDFEPLMQFYRPILLTYSGSVRLIISAKFGIVIHI